jgi:hypothetical protein
VYQKKTRKELRLLFIVLFLTVICPQSLRMVFNLEKQYYLIFGLFTYQPVVLNLCPMAFWLVGDVPRLRRLECASHDEIALAPAMSVRARAHLVTATRGQSPLGAYAERSTPTLSGLGQRTPMTDTRRM